MTVDAAWLPMIYERNVLECDAQAVPIPEVAVFTPVTEAFPWVAHTRNLEPPMQLLARGVQQQQLNLLTHQYKPKKELSKHWLIWKQPALFCAVFLALVLSIKSVNIWQNGQKSKQLQSQIIQVYKAVLPMQKPM